MTNTAGQTTTLSGLIIDDPDGIQNDLWVTGGIYDGSGTHLLSGSSVTLITSTQVLALHATPQTLVAAPGAGLAILPAYAVVYKPAGTAYTVGSTSDLSFNYTNGSGAGCLPEIETTGFLDQATAQTRVVVLGKPAAAIGDITPTANAAVVVNILAAEVTGGTAPLYIKIYYSVIPTVLP